MYVILLLATAAIASVPLWYQNFRQTMPVTVNGDQNSPSIFKQGIYQISYPKDYFLFTNLQVPPYASSYFSDHSAAEAAIIIPTKYFQKTNFSEAGLLISKKSKLSAVDCRKYANGASSTLDLTQSETVNGIPFAKAEFSGAAAGNLYETKLYRSFRNSTCYEISLTLHTTNIGNYPPGAVIEVEKTQAWKKLDDVLQTFKFTDQAASVTPGAPKAKGTIMGHVDIGPNCPVERIGNPCPANYSSTRIVIYASDGRTVVTKTDLNAKGDYSVDLPTGDYEVDYERPGSMYAHDPQPITIVAGETIQVDFSLDTGIR
jgi:hypothetical protein